MTTVTRTEVAAVLGHGASLEVSVTVIAPEPDDLPSVPLVVVAIPGGTSHRRYRDLHPPAGPDT